jgi:hypothetical protein
MKLIDAIVERLVEIRATYGTLDQTTSGAWPETHAVFEPIDQVETGLKEISKHRTEDPGDLPDLDSMVDDRDRLLALADLVKRYGRGWSELLVQAAEALPDLRSRMDEADKMRAAGIDPRPPPSTFTKG